MPRSIYERRAQTELETEGYFVEWKMRRPRIMRRGKYTQDFFNLFDLCAYKVDEAMRWISIKGRQGIPGAHRRAIEAFKLPPQGHIKEIWARSLATKTKNYWHKIIIE